MLMLLLQKIGCSIIHWLVHHGKSHNEPYLSYCFCLQTYQISPIGCGLHNCLNGHLVDSTSCGAQNTWFFAFGIRFASWSLLKEFPEFCLTLVPQIDRQDSIFFILCQCICTFPSFFRDLFQWVSLKIGYDLPIHGHFHRTFVILQPALEKFSGQRPSLDFFRGPRTLSFRFTTKELEVGENLSRKPWIFPMKSGAIL